MLMINGIPSYFAKVSDFEKELQPVIERLGIYDHIYLIDLALTKPLVSCLVDNWQRGVTVSVFDHHKPEQIRHVKDQEYITELETLMSWTRCPTVIVSRKEAPGCAMLVKTPVAKIQADQGGHVTCFGDKDADGLLGVMALCGISYEGMAEDAAILDGPRNNDNKLTEFAQLYTKALSKLPTYDNCNPVLYNDAWERWASLVVRGAQQDQDALRELRNDAQAYEASVERANAIHIDYSFDGKLAIATLTDSKERLDLNTLTKRMETPKVKVTVVVKTIGPIVSAGFDKQLTVSIRPAFQKELDARDAVKGLTSDPKGGVIANEGFRIHVNSSIYTSRVLPWLAKVLSK